MNTQTRSRLALLALALAVLGSAYYFATFSRSTINDMETRAVAGDFPLMHVEEGEAQVDDNGRVENHQAEPGILRYVATMRLVPPGKYQAIIVAADGNEAHRKKSELVIGARDASGTWHPASAAHLVENISPLPVVSPSPSAAASADPAASTSPSLAPSPSPSPTKHP